MKKLFFSLFAVGLLAACTPKTQEVVDTVESMKFPNDRVGEGYSYYSTTCARCHNAKTVTDYSREQWDKILPNMAQRAKMDTISTAKVDEYINWILEN